MAQPRRGHKTEQTAGKGQAAERDGAPAAGVARPGNGLCQPSRGAPASERGKGSPSLLRADGDEVAERNLSVHPAGALPLLPLGALLPLVPTDGLREPKCRRALPRAALRTMRGAQAAEGGSRVGCGGGAWGGAAAALLREQSLAAPSSAGPSAGSHHRHPQRQLGRSQGACRNPPAPALAPAAARQLLPSPPSLQGRLQLRPGSETPLQEGRGQGAATPSCAPLRSGGLQAGWLSRAQCPELQGSGPPRLCHPGVDVPLTRLLARFVPGARGHGQGDAGVPGTALPTWLGADGAGAGHPLAPLGPAWGRLEAALGGPHEGQNPVETGPWGSGVVWGQGDTSGSGWGGQGRRGRMAPKGSPRHRGPREGWGVQLGGSEGKTGGVGVWDGGELMAGGVPSGRRRWSRGGNPGMRGPR